MDEKFMNLSCDLSVLHYCSMALTVHEMLSVTSQPVVEFLNSQSLTGQSMGWRVHCVLTFCVGTSSNCAGLPFQGSCPGGVTGWTYDTNSRQCVTFTWGVCQQSRNANNYNTQTACQQSCGGKNVVCLWYKDDRWIISF